MAPSLVARVFFDCFLDTPKSSDPSRSGRVWRFWGVHHICPAADRARGARKREEMNHSNESICLITPKRLSQRVRSSVCPSSKFFALVRRARALFILVSMMHACCMDASHIYVQQRRQWSYSNHTFTRDFASLSQDVLHRDGVRVWSSDCRDRSPCQCANALITLLLSCLAASQQQQHDFLGHVQCVIVYPRYDESTSLSLHSSVGTRMQKEYISTASPHFYIPRIQVLGHSFSCTDSSLCSGRRRSGTSHPTSGLTIIPVSIIVYRTQLGAVNPADIFLPILIATFLQHWQDWSV